MAKPAGSYCLLSCLFVLLVSFVSAAENDQDKQVIAQIILC